MEVGSVYKLDHSKLPRSVSSQLGHVKAVMVSEKTRSRVSVSYPSKGSLEMMFGGGRRTTMGLMQPNLDLVYTMNVNLAETVLCNRISFEEFATRRGNQSFWMDGNEEDERGGGGGGGVGLKLTWGLRKRASFVRKHSLHRESVEREVSVEVEGMKEEGEEEESVEVEGGEMKVLARKRKHPSEYVKKKKKKKRGPVEVGMNDEDDEFNDPTTEANFRWTKIRYKKAEKGILKIMKAKGAYHGYPILRADLRTEARKLIGDTGLLDHLLKHMAGKVAPGGKERFRRRHNPNGAMEYWLESADLVSIRKEAGVDDTYWIPPEGWKLGDSPTQDPVCAKELKKLREDVDNMKSDIQELRSEKSGHEKAIGDDPEICLDDAESRKKFVLMPLKAMKDDLLKKKAKIEEKVLVVAKAMSDIEEDLRRYELEAKGRIEGARATAASTGAINEAASEICSVEKEREKKEETKADRRKRLKSGFSICKPSGTFLWPSDISTGGAAPFSAQLMTQIDDFLAVSSPSSVCSSKSPLPLAPPPSAPADHLLPPPPPPPAILRPVAKRPTLGVSVSSATRGWSGSSGMTKDRLCVASPTASSANSVVFVPDLNEAPLDVHPTNLDSPSFAKSAFSSSFQGTYPFHPSGGLIGLRAPPSMNHATTSTTRLQPAPATQSSRINALPLTYVRASQASPRLPFCPQVQ